MEAFDAVKDLRDRVGITQQELANRLGISSRAVANYEAGRTPASAVLLGLIHLAGEYGQMDNARIFSAAHAAAVSSKLEPATEEEKALVRLVLCLARDKRHVPEWEGLKSALVAALENLAAAPDFAADARTLDEAMVLARMHLIPNAERQLAMLADKRSRLKGENYHQAYAAILLENPQLYKEYLNERAVAAGASIGESVKPKRKNARKQK